MNLLTFIESKVMDAYSLHKNLALWRFESEKIVFTNGCFDLLHRGHIQYLAQARMLGTKLIVGLNSDESVQRLKGPGRPINDENSRSLMLASMLFVDAVIIFTEDTPLELIGSVLPDILVKGGDYHPDTIVGADVVRQNGGSVLALPFLEGFSSTKIAKKIVDSSSE